MASIVCTRPCNTSLGVCRPRVCRVIGEFEVVEGSRIDEVLGVEAVEVGARGDLRGGGITVSRAGHDGKGQKSRHQDYSQHCQPFE